MEGLLVIIAIVALVWIVVSLLTYTNITKLSNISLESCPGAEPGQQEQQWAQENGFELVGNYRMQLGNVITSIWAWRRPDRPTFFCRYLSQVGNMSRVAYDLVTEFADDVSLTTGDTNDGQLTPPRPGVYKQTFSNMSLDERWYQHVEAENYLMDYGKARLEALSVPFEEAITEAVHKESAFVRSIPFWPLRGPWWYFVRRRLWHNKSIRKQHEQGKIILPCDLSAIGAEDLLRTGQ